MKGEPMNHGKRLLFIIVMSISTNVMAATVDEVITYQGKLEKNGVPVSGTRDFVFILYGVETGNPSPFGIVERQNHPVTDGIFTVELPFEKGMWSNQEKWLEIQVREFRICVGQPDRIQ